MIISSSQLDDPDKPPVFLVFVIVVVTFIVVFACWFFSNAFLSRFTDSAQARIETGMGNKTRLSYIENEHKYLNSSAPLEQGHQKIPIDEAMAKVIEKENK